VRQFFNWLKTSCVVRRSFHNNSNKNSAVKMSISEHNRQTF